MVKVSDMIGDDDHSGALPGWHIPQEIAENVANEMRELLEAIYKYNCVLDQDVQLAAWGYLNAMERRAWKLVVQARGRPRVD
jgi:hypothetical protein